MAVSTTKRKKARASSASGALPRHGIRSIGVGVSLLNVIAKLGRPSTLTEIAAASGMSATRAHRYLLGLASTRLVEHDPLSSRYELGPQIVELGVAALGRIDAVKVGLSAMAALTEKTRHASVICVWGTNGPTVIRSEHAGLDTAVRIREGRNLGMLHSASGRIFLAYLPRQKTAALLQQEIRLWDAAAKGVPPPGEARIEAIIANVRAKGAASSNGGQLPEFAAVAAPVFDHQHNLALSIASIGTAGHFDVSLDGPIADAVRAAAADLSRRLGGNSLV